MTFTHGEGFDWPDNLTVLRHPLHTAHCSFKLGWVGIRWHWNVDLHVVGSGTPFKLTLCLRWEPDRSSLKTKLHLNRLQNQCCDDSREQELNRFWNTRTTSAQQAQDITHYFLLPLIASTCNEATKETQAHTDMKTSNLDHVLNPAVGMFLNNRFNPD